jgi:small subunit ribosomal protein S17
MDKTVVITVNSVKTHPLYKKRYIVKKKYYAHDEDNACTVGQVVKNKTK